MYRAEEEHYLLPGADNVLAVIKIHIFDLLLVGGFALVSLEDSHGFFNLYKRVEDEDQSNNNVV